VAVWVHEGHAGQGDVVLVPAGNVVRVGEVLADGTTAWRAEVSPELLPGLPQTDEPREIDDEQTLRAVRGVLSAERERGG